MKPEFVADTVVEGVLKNKRHIYVPEALWRLEALIKYVGFILVNYLNEIVFILYSYIYRNDILIYRVFPIIS